MGGGDCNDGMNRVGHGGRGGRGDSVWPAWAMPSAIMQRTAIDSILGLEVAGHRVRLRPQLPGH